MEFKGTKGKWELHGCPFKNNVSSFFVQAVGSHSDNIMLPANAFGITEIESKYNAQLISCAPEMLEMLIKFSELIDESIDLKNSIPMPIFNLNYDVQKLIKKATTI